MLSIASLRPGSSYFRKITLIRWIQNVFSCNRQGYIRSIEYRSSIEYLSSIIISSFIASGIMASSIIVSSVTVLSILVVVVVSSVVDR